MGASRTNDVTNGIAQTQPGAPVSFHTQHSRFLPPPALSRRRTEFARVTEQKQKQKTSTTPPGTAEGLIQTCLKSGVLEPYNHCHWGGPYPHGERDLEGPPAAGIPARCLEQAARAQAGESCAAGHRRLRWGGEPL